MNKKWIDNSNAYVALFLQGLALVILTAIWLFFTLFVTDDSYKAVYVKIQYATTPYAILNLIGIIFCFRSFTQDKNIKLSFLSFLTFVASVGILVLLIALSF